MHFKNRKEKIEYLIRCLKELSRQEYGFNGLEFNENIPEDEKREKALMLYDTVMPILYSRKIPVDAIWDDSVEHARLFLAMFI